MTLPKDFREFLELMISNNVDFVMIGGWAYNHYANPSGTGDIDCFISIDSNNEIKVRQVLEAFGFGSTLPPTTEKFLKKDKVFMLGRAPMRIDLITTIDGVTYDEVKNAAVTVDFFGLKIPVISLAHLIINKKAAGRPKDLVDAAELEKISKQSR